MKFKYSVIFENTEDARKHLEMLGYAKWIWDDEDNDVPFISTMPESKQYAAFTYEEVEGFENDIDCRSNPPLFKAVSAMREDSDKYQLLVDELTELLTGEIKLVMCTEDNKKDMEVYTTFRKATLTELINHFK